MAMEFAREMEIALQCAASASRLCMGVQSDFTALGSLVKDDKTPVTIADYGSQAVLCRSIKNAFPSDPVVAEETSKLLELSENASLLDKVTDAVRMIFQEADKDDVRRWIDQGTKEISKRYWCVDPIDGTKGFLRGDQYAVAVALVLDGTVQLGVLACPNLPQNLTNPEGPRGVIFSASRGKGAFQSPLEGAKPMPIHVQGSREIKRLKFCESFESSHSDHALQRRIGKKLGIEQPPIQMDSQAKYGLVARGEASIYLRLPSPNTPDYREKVWDHAAGAILVEEAGGKVSDTTGNPLNFSTGYQLVENTGVVATNALLHDEVLDALSNEDCAKSIDESIR